METRANYVLIGAFTILAVLAGLGFFLWLAKVQIDRAYAQYDIVFDSAAGLAQSSPVRFNGVDVGQVIDIALDPQEAARVRVRIEVDASTPIRQGIEATLESQGVTGVSFVGLSGTPGPNSERFPVEPGGDAPVIPSKPSVVQGLIEDAPDLLEQAISLLEDLNKFTGPENQDRISSILSNVDAATGRLDEALTDFAEVSDNVGKVVTQVSGFTERLDEVAANADRTLDTANSALQGFDAFGKTALPRITDAATEVQRLIAALLRLTARIERDPARFLLGNQTPEYRQ